MSTKSRTSYIPLCANSAKRGKYPTLSMTSRKTIPARFAKQAKAAQSQCGSSPEDEFDELRDQSPPLDPTLGEQISYRGRRNISARNSRCRRLQQMEELEKQRDSLSKLVHNYRDYILALRANFSNNGISLPEPPFFRPP
ncbi:hypothetical protein F5887DRAFT_890865 [Amanita rubescens]|nr:hypothetical protein F5887DRAFT_890865 [Amanita rubescens]